MKCPKCFWHDYYKICPICDHQIPEERNYIKEGFLRCHDCGAITHKNVKTLETNFHSPSKESTKKRINLFPFLSNHCVFDSFCYCFFNKVFKTVSLVWFYCENQFISRVLLSVLLKLVLSLSMRKQYFVAVNLLFD